MAYWEVIVGNIGKVFEGNNGFLAQSEYRRYMGMSKRGYGRASGESVSLWRDNEPIKEFTGTNNSNE